VALKAHLKNKIASTITITIGTTTFKNSAVETKNLAAGFVLSCSRRVAATSFSMSFIRIHNEKAL
jgi:hypothetical protein